MHLGRGPAGVERPSYGGGSEAVDGGPAAGLHVSDQGQLARELLLERTGRDRGQVGLQQHVVHRSREQVVERLGGVVPCDERSAERRDAVQAGDAEQRGLVDRRTHLGEADGGPTRTSPAHPLDERRGAGPGGQGVVLAQVGQLGEHVGAQLDQPAPREVGGQGVHRLVADPSAHRGDEARVREPGPREGGPALRDRASLPGVVGVGREPRGVGVVGHALVEQAGGGRGLDHERGNVDLDVQQGRCCAQIAYGEPAGLQRSGRVAAPPVEEQLGASYELEGRAGRSPVDQRLLAFGGRQPGWLVELPVSGHPQPEAHRPRDRHVPLVDAVEQAGGHQVGGRSGATTPPTVRTGLVEMVEDPPGRRSEPVQQAGNLVGRTDPPGGAAGHRPRAPAVEVIPRPAPATRVAPSPGRRRQGWPAGPQARCPAPAPAARSAPAHPGRRAHGAPTSSRPPGPPAARSRAAPGWPGRVARRAARTAARRASSGTGRRGCAGRTRTSGEF